MSTVTLIGIDLGKHSLHLHGQDATGRLVFRKKCSRQQLFTLLGNRLRTAQTFRRFTRHQERLAARRITEGCADRLYWLHPLDFRRTTVRD